MFHLVSVALYRFCVAQYHNRSNGSDQCWQHITGSVNTLRCLGYRNNHCNVECELCLTVWIAVEWRERIPSHCDRLLLDRFHDCSWDPIDSRIRIKCASERTGQSAIILPEYLVQPNSGDKRHHVLRAINAYWILYIFGVHRVYWQWDGESAFHCIDDDWGRICDIQCPKRKVVFWSWKWGHDNRWIW